MRRTQLISLILVFYTFIGALRTPILAANRTRAVTSRLFNPGKVIDTVICQKDPTQSYALYIPANGNKAPMPAIYFFDAHANGSLPLNKYKSLADIYGFILIGSNNSKNGNDWPVTDNIWRTLFDDTQSRLNINRSRIYTAGFSGGAKVAGYVALQNPRVKGVIANGAGLPDGTPAGDFNFSFTAIAGDGDMNLTELAGITKDLDKSRTRHRIIVFDGKHEWAPVSSMSMAFTGLQFDAMKERLLPNDSAFISSYIAKSKNKFDAYYKTHQLLKASQECELSISFLYGLTTQVSWFKDRSASLAANPLYQKQVRAQNDLLVREQNTKTEYRSHFQANDKQYWAKTIKGLKTGSETGTAESAMYRRLLAWLSLAFYSVSNHLINSNSNTEARYFVDLYKMADPDNSEAWYFSAILNARDNNGHAAEADLWKAAGYGFTDKTRLRQQPEFKELQASINLSRIESNMHGPLKK
ncbi:MAG TPA: hypothetical protein VNS58_19600 [Puia sp.]|nr:hypothetical protein [Puia sp.]